MRLKAIRATYEKGFLKPEERLALEENQEVLVFVIPLEREYGRSRRLAAMREKVEQWLGAQSEDAVRPPLVAQDLPDPELERMIETIRREASRYSPEEIAADVEAALAEVRGLSPEEMASVRTEIDELIAELTAIKE